MLQNRQIWYIYYIIVKLFDLFNFTQMIVLLKTTAAIFCLTVHVFVESWFPVESLLGKLLYVYIYTYIELKITIDHFLTNFRISFARTKSLHIFNNSL